ncbi:GNAT family N-acetyltransferase [Aeromicrobium sp. CF3.5]|uniref:GNAT family N-acetyltransferase n=1 Tax=Aeromicrobium sp. CF3.5 TaxID=3373078 RepID=UPI003EE78748
MSTRGIDHDGNFRLDRLSRRTAATPIGPVRIGDDLIFLRQARWSDGPAWVATRRRDGQRMRNVFGETSLTTWVEHLVEQRRAVRAGLRVPLLATHVDGRVLGEVNFHLDPTTGSAEISFWFARGTSRDVTAWVTASSLLRLYQLPARVPRVMAPIAANNPGPRRLLAHWGFTERAVSRELRPYDGVPVDHDIWWLERDADQLADLARGMTDPML